MTGADSLNMGYRLNPRSIAVVGGGAAGLAAAY
jgi:predicted NAD/FAD-binding protein